jgi:DNA-binding PadR family transcriptional regulator
MKAEQLTSTELMVLGLVAEMPRHGYDLEQVIVRRGMREWTSIGFSSIYFVLGKLEQKHLVVAAKPASAKAKKSYSITEKGREVLVRETLAAFGNIRTSSSPLLMGMLHWPVLSREQAIGALQKRSELVNQELVRLEGIHFNQQPLPDHVDALFEFSIHQLKAESKWISKTLAYMQTKPWNDTK